MKVKLLTFADGTTISDDSPVFIIAEIGQNHQGDINIAKKLIIKAKECQANCVKFQKSVLSEKFTKYALDVPYSSPHSWGQTYGEHKKHLEFSEAQYKELQNYANENGILFSASAMDLKSLEFLNFLSVPFIKIGSGDSTNILLLREAAKTKRPLIISTGMCSMEDVEEIFNIVSSEHKNFALLQCVSAYPTKSEDANLCVITKYKLKFPILIGYSGHELGFNLTLAAVALGAKIIERHITLDKTWKGNDHSCSLDVSEFKAMVQGIREIEKSLGAEKIFYPCEEACWKKLGKSLVASRDIDAGCVLTLNDLTIKVSIPKGLPGKMLDKAIGRTVMKRIKADSPICESDLNVT